MLVSERTEGGLAPPSRSSSTGLSIKGERADAVSRAEVTSETPRRQAGQEDSKESPIAVSRLFASTRWPYVEMAISKQRLDPPIRLRWLVYRNAPAR